VVERTVSRKHILRQTGRFTRRGIINDRIIMTGAFHPEILTDEERTSRHSIYGNETQRTDYHNEVLRLWHIITDQQFHRRSYWTISIVAA